jgi:hypothetical protein
VVEPLFAEAFEHVAEHGRGDDKTVADWNAVQDQQRLAPQWTMPAPPPAAAVDVYIPTVADDAIEFLWVGDTARHVGTVVHRWLVRIADEGLEHWSADRISAQTPVFRVVLARLGVPEHDINEAATRVGSALNRVLADKRAHWLLQAHPQAQSEYALTGVLDGRIVSVVLDRTFIDNDGTRWIVDYKTSGHAGGGVDDFLDSERDRYAAQLHRYARLLLLKEKRPIKLGLYFPLLHGWREWRFEGE